MKKRMFIGGLMLFLSLVNGVYGTDRIDRDTVRAEKKQAKKAKEKVNFKNTLNQLMIL